MPWKTTLRALALAGAALGTAGTAFAQANAEQREPVLAYDLPAQALGETLMAIARRANHEILFETDAVRGLRAPPVSGRLTFDQAVRTALSGSALVLDYREGAAIIRSSSAAPVPAVAPGNATGAITVTGTRIRGAGSASPIIVTSRKDLEQAGIADLGDFTRLLPQNYAGGQNRGIPGGGEQGGQQNLNNSSTLNLRGLGPDATLTLLDGHRLAYDTVNQGVDISAIPLAAIERIEVVTDGASALYGSDAVGGVANIILRREFDGLEATARIGASADGGDVWKQVSLVGGGRWSSGGFMAALDWNSATPIYAGQRDYARNVDPSLTLTNRNRQASGVLSARQQIVPGLAIDLDGYVMERRSLLQNPFLTTADVHFSGIVSKPHVTSWAIAPTLRTDLGPWSASIALTRAGSRSLLDNRNYQSGVERHFNSLYANSLRGVEANAEGPLIALPGGDARLAVGAGFRKIALHLHQELLSDAGRTTLQEFTEGRRVRYAFGELSLPLVGPDLAIPFVRRLTLSGALRHERWQGIDTVTTPKAGLIYQPTADLTLRGTWGKSFKIPTLREVNEIQDGILIPGFYFSPAPEPAGSPVLLLSGSVPDLRPERATTWSGTAEFTPTAVPGLKLQASWFDIDYRGRIAGPISDVLTSLGNPVYQDLIVFNPSAEAVLALIASLPGGLVNQTGQPFDPAGVGAIVDTAIRNTARQRIKGIDLAADYQFALGMAGTLLLTGSASHLKSNQQLAAGFPTVPLAGTVFNPPHWRARGGAVWTGKTASVAAFVNHIGSTRDSRYPANERIGGFTTFDVSANLRTGAESGALKNLELRLSALNLLDEQPETIPSPFPNAAPYDSSNQSPVGRFLSAAIRKTF